MNHPLALSINIFLSLKSICHFPNQPKKKKKMKIAIKFSTSLSLLKPSFVANLFQILLSFPSYSFRCLKSQSITIARTSNTCLNPTWLLHLPLFLSLLFRPPLSHPLNLTWTLSTHFSLPPPCSGIVLLNLPTVWKPLLAHRTSQSLCRKKKKMGRHSCCLKQKLRKGLWSPEEDEKLFNHITRFGVGCWSSVPKLAGISLLGSFVVSPSLLFTSGLFEWDHIFVYDKCRATEVWEELQAEMDKLPEARLKERCVFARRRACDHWPPWYLGQ